MIKVSRLNAQELAINCDLIERIESRPDTTLRFINGNSLVVRESLEEVLLRIEEYRGNVLRRAGLGTLVTMGAPPHPLALVADDDEDERSRAIEDICERSTS